jgi:mRNA interferase HigB
MHQYGFHIRIDATPMISSASHNAKFALHASHTAKYHCLMHVVSVRPLRDFWQKHPQAEIPLRAWYKNASHAQWKKFEDVKATYSSADRVAQFIIFDIGANKWRIITVIHYNVGTVYVRHVFTHAKYDAWSQALKKSKKKK